MRIAIFSDVHGNLTALEAVLAHIKQQEVDEILFAGDLCLAGPRPAACLQRVRELGLTAVYGNTDEFLVDRGQPPEWIAPLCRWTAAQLSQAQKKWLTALPFSHRISPTGTAKDDLLIVHANPQDVNQVIFPPAAMQMARWGRIEQSDEALGDLLANVDAAVLAFGHLHMPNVRTWSDLRLANISSVSLPADDDPRAKYGIFTWAAGIWSIQHHYVAYDAQLEAVAYRQQQPPGWEKSVQTIAERGFLPQ